MKILNRYILKEIVSPFAIGVLAFTFLFLAQWMFKLMDWMVIGGVPFSLVMAMVLSFIPFIMTMTFPMSLLLGCIFAFGRMSEQNEIQAMLTCGQTYWKIIRPVLVLGLICTGFLLFWAEFVAPKAASIQTMTMFRIIEKTSPVAVLEESKFSTKLPGKVMYLQKIDLAERKVSGMAIFDMVGNKIRAAVMSPEGRIHYSPEEMTLTLEFEGGEVLMNVEEGDPGYSAFDGRIMLVIDAGKMLAKMLRGKEIMTGLPRSQLSEQRRELLADGVDTKEEAKKIEWINAELSNRLVMPFACLAFAAIGAPLAFWMERGSRGACFVMALTVIASYYFLMVFGEALAERGYLGYQLGAWIPNVVIGTVGMVFNIHLGRK